MGGIGSIEALPEVVIGDKPVLNLYSEMVSTFDNPLIVAIYILGVISLCWHLIHGFQSAFQTLGINHKKYTPLIKNVGIGFSVLICLVFIMMPLALHFGWVV